MRTKKGPQKPPVKEFKEMYPDEYYSGSYVLQPIGQNRPRFRQKEDSKSGLMEHARDGSNLGIEIDREKVRNFKNIVSLDLLQPMSLAGCCDYDYNLYGALESTISPLLSPFSRNATSLHQSRHDTNELNDEDLALEPISGNDYDDLDLDFRKL